MLVDVVVRTDCPVADAASPPSSCTLTRFRQNLRKKSVTDYQFYSTTTLAPPASYSAPADFANRCLLENPMSRPDDCLEVSYYGNSLRGNLDRDVVDGPVYTADPVILTCGDPEFRSTVSVVGGVDGKAYLPADSARARGGVCPPGSPVLGDSLADTNAPLVAMPYSGDYLAKALDEIKNLTTPGDYEFTESELAGTPLKIVLSRNVYDPLNPDSKPGDNRIALRAGGKDLTPLYSGSWEKTVLVVRGDVEIEGEYSGVLGVYATGSITITSNLTYAAGASTDSSNMSDLIALVAANDIRISQGLEPGGQRDVYAVLVAVTGGVYTEGWNTARSWAGSPTPPRLRFFGSMASRYQGVFGGYNKGTGELVSGYIKDFRFDPRVMDKTVANTPSFLAPSGDTSGWVRVGFTDAVPCPSSSSDTFLRAYCGLG